LDELINHFSYTLLTGNEYDSKINKNPKTISQLISNLNKSVSVTQNSYDRDSYRLL